MAKGIYDRKDRYYQKAKKEGLASRAAYKLTEIQSKYKIIRSGSKVLDVGCAPGGWLQSLSKMVGPKGLLVGIDQLPLKIQTSPNTVFLQKNIEEEGLALEFQKILAGADFFDVIVSDISPDLSGIPFRDIYNSYELSLKVWKLANQFLKKGGNFVSKIFPGEETNKLKVEIKKNFKRFVTFIPEATRKTSNEVYLIGLGYSTPQIR
ncbi:MAG: RlmE family RNA methyltransferase [Deltaproteobacteria bacterium]|nr:RlmE family RNA methyltransferase [Deltaproteobacteria bacterium]